MPSILTVIAGGLALAASVSADLQRGQIFNRAAKYTTVRTTTTITTTGAVAYVVNSGIYTTGPQTLIPGALTVTFNELPAYIYMETFTTGSTVITSTYKTRIAVAATQKTTTPISSITSAAQPASSTGGTPTIVTTNTATCCSNTGATYVPDSLCDGKVEGEVCGSFHTCYGGGCYWFNYDYQCGAINIACNTDANYHCVNGVCKDTLFDVNNCGQAYEQCGGNLDETYGCYQGICVSLSSDSDHCGSLGNVCPTGTGCKAGTCIDTTSDNDNCSVVGYACPSGTTCMNSLCL